MMRRLASRRVQSVLGAAITIVNDLGIAWSQNASGIEGAISGITADISGLANGALPVFSFALGAAVAEHRIKQDHVKAARGRSREEGVRIRGHDKDAARGY